MFLARKSQRQENHFASWRMSKRTRPIVWTTRDNKYKSMCNSDYIASTVNIEGNEISWMQDCRPSCTRICVKVDTNECLLKASRKRSYSESRETGIRPCCACSRSQADVTVNNLVIKLIFQWDWNGERIAALEHTLSVLRKKVAL